VNEASELQAYLEWSPWRRRRVALVLVLPALVLALQFWLQDRPALLTVTALLVDRMFILATLLLLISIGLLLGTWRQARTGTLMAGVVSVAMGLSVCLTVRQPVEFSGVAVGVLTMLAGSGLVYLVEHGRILSWEFRPRSAAVLLSGLLALLPLLQFWHVASFVPSRSNTTIGATVSADAALARSGPSGL
jgi:hypothetical protein